MALPVDFKVDVVVPFADNPSNLESLASWLSKENIPKNFRIILVHDIDKHDLVSIELNQMLLVLNPESFLYIKGRFGSPGAARNAGLGMTTAQWICFWDSDDYPLPQEFNTMIAAGIRNNSQICIGKFEIIHHKSRARVISTRGNSQIAVAITPGFWRMAILKKSIGNVLFSDSKMGEDQLFLFAIDFGSLRWYKHDRVVYQYVTGIETQLTNSMTNYSNLLATFCGVIEVSQKRLNSGANLIYSIMQARLALTLLLKLPMEKTSGILLEYLKECVSSPKKFLFGTVPAYATVMFDLILQAIVLVNNKVKGRNA